MQVEDLVGEEEKGMSYKLGHFSFILEPSSSSNLFPLPLNQVTEFPPPLNLSWTTHYYLFNCLCFLPAWNGSNEGDCGRRGY